MKTVEVQIWHDAASGFYRVAFPGHDFGLSPRKEDMIYWELNDDGHDGQTTYNWEEVKEVPMWAASTMVALAYSEASFDTVDDIRARLKETLGGGERTPLRQCPVVDEEKGRSR